MVQVLYCSRLPCTARGFPAISEVFPATTFSTVPTSVLPGAGCGTSSVLPETVTDSSPVVAAPVQIEESRQSLLAEKVAPEPRGAEVDPPSSKDGDDEGEEDGAISVTPKKTRRVRATTVGFTEPVVRQIDTGTPTLHDLLEGGLSS